MNIEESRDDNRVLLSIAGKIDINSANEFQSTLLKAFQKASNVVIDMHDVAYISSAGLRVLVIGQKTAMAKGGKMIITNVSPAVADVFRVSGFDKGLTIQ